MYKIKVTNRSSVVNMEIFHFKRTEIVVLQLSLTLEVGEDLNRLIRPRQVYYHELEFKLFYSVVQTQQS